MALRWVEEFCPDVSYVLKTDDDGFNVPQRFVDFLLGIKVIIHRHFFNEI